MAESAGVVNGECPGEHKEQEVEDDMFEQDLKEMLKHGPDLNDLSATVQSGLEGNDDKPEMNRPPSQLPNSMPNSEVPKSKSMPEALSGNVHKANTTMPLSPGGNSVMAMMGNQGDMTGSQKSMPEAASSRVDFLKSWSVNQFKCTKQFLTERFGKGSRTIDMEMDSKIEGLRETQRKYANILRLARSLSNHFYYVVQTQRALGENFTELAQKSPELQEEFSYNAETQRNLVKNGDTLLGALNFFISSVNTLCNKTIDDTLLTVKQYEHARLEYDAYRNDLEEMQSGPHDSSVIPKLEEAKKKFQFHKNKFDKYRNDVNIKLQFLHENKVKVMHKQLLLFHNAIAAYFSGNNEMLEATMKQFNIKLKKPNADSPSWIEDQ